MSARVRLLAFGFALAAALAVTVTAHAGAFVFAGEANGVDLIAHPAGYGGVGGLLTVTVCIDPASPNAAAMEIPVRNLAATYTALSATSPNLLFGGANDVPPASIDFESVALHEVGHCIGLAHPNLASESGLSDPSANATKSTNGVNNVFNVAAGGDGLSGSSDESRGDDVNLHWFNAANDPFALETTIDGTTYSRDVADLPGGHAFAVNADRAVGAALGVSDTEAVMQQGTFGDEDQRELAADDLATLRLAMSGLDEIQGTIDDYALELEYAGMTTACNVVLRFDNAATGFAACATSGVFLSGAHAAVTTATASFNTGVSWFFNDELKPAIFADGFELGSLLRWSSSAP